MEILTEHYYNNNTPIIYKGCTVYRFDTNSTAQFVTVVNGTAIELTVKNPMFSPVLNEAWEHFKDMIDKRFKRDSFIDKIMEAESV